MTTHAGYARGERRRSIDGSYQAQTREKFSAYAAAWVERYRGNGRRGFTENTREEYRRGLVRYAIPRLGKLVFEQAATGERPSLERLVDVAMESTQRESGVQHELRGRQMADGTRTCRSSAR